MSRIGCRRAGGVFLAIATLTSEASAEKSIPSRREQALSELKFEWGRALARIAELKAQVNSMSARILQLGRLTEVQGYDSDEAKAERAALAALDKDLGRVAEAATSEKRVQALFVWLANGLVQAESVDPTTCFDKEANFIPRKACRSYLDAHCSMTYADWGALKGRVINEDWTVQDRSLEDEFDFYEYVRRSGQPSLLDSLHFSFCRAVASSGYKFDFGWAWIPDTPSWYYESFLPFGSAENFDASCKRRDYDTEAFYIERAAKPLAKGFSKDSLIRWAATARQRSKQCQTAVVNECGEIFFVREEPILSYITTRCVRREVSRSDVQRDMVSFDTDAERLQHSTLIDRMNLCVGARAAGYVWRWKKPSLKGCVPGR